MNLSTILLAILCLAGSILLIWVSFFNPSSGMPIEPGLFSEKIKIPLQFINIGLTQFPLEVENYLVFQNFESLPPIVQRFNTLSFGIITWFLISLAMVYISTFTRSYFIISSVAVIVLMLLSGVNGLNIGAINSNYAFIILILGLMAPSVIINTFFNQTSLIVRGLTIFTIAAITLPILTALSQVTDPYLMFSENISLVNMIITVLFFAYIGHSVITAIFYMLIKMNKGVGIKITWHLTVLFLIYLVMLIFTFLDLTGNMIFGMPTPPIPLMVIIVGALGFIEVNLKIDQIRQPYSYKIIGQMVYLIGFAIALFTFWKAEFSVNEPMADFLKHSFIYTQLAFSLLFFGYLMANFSDLMNSGQSIERVIFEPNFFAYFHMRIGSLIAMISLVLFADGVLALQFGASSTNVTADYYYATERPLEAGILYENSWARYRKNKKSKNASAHLKMVQNQPTLAIRELEESFELSPSVNDIIFLSSVLHRQDKIFDAIFFLEKGLDLFPENSYLKNNLALLQSKINQGEMAYELLNGISHEAAIANKIGIQTKHLIKTEQVATDKDNLLASINRLALENLKGNYSDIMLLSDEHEMEPTITTKALLANQWSNKTIRSTSEDLAMIDRILAQDISSGEEEDYRQIRILRSLQGNHINQALTYINGLAFNYPGSSGFYHHMAAMVYTSQLDFEKAARELVRAEEKGFRNFRPEHLLILYFGQQMDRAELYAIKHEVAWPKWMVFHDNRLVLNEEVVFLNALSTLNESTKNEFLEHLASIRREDLKARYAYEIIWKKSHWLDRAAMESLKAILMKNEAYVHERAFIDDLVDLMDSMDASQVKHDRLLHMITLNKLDQNAYRTPFIFMAVDQVTDPIAQYNILQEATDYNRDPLLWIHLVRQSRLAGLDQYAGEALNTLRGWVDDATLEALQIEHL
ncbi:tetratricopeptide repeat protein [Anditalea andensis]|nr:hypothetical protein [Anditalea andensis]